MRQKINLGGRQQLFTQELDSCAQEHQVHTYTFLSVTNYFTFDV